MSKQVEECVVMEMMVLLLVKDSTNISRVTLCIGCCAYLVPRTKVCFTHTHARFPSVFHLFSYLFFFLLLYTMNLSGDMEDASDKILFLNFNQEFSCVSVGTETGYRLYNCDPFGRCYSKCTLYLSTAYTSGYSPLFL